MNKYDVRRLQKQLESMKKSTEPVYLKLIDVIYKCPNDSGQLIEVDSVPTGSLVEELNCTADELYYFFCVNNKPVYTVIKSVTKAILDGDLEDDKGWLDKNGIE